MSSSSPRPSAVVEQRFAPCAGPDAPATARAIRFLWIVLTNRCQRECEHCYPESGPLGTHGAMTMQDWRNALTEAAGLGTTMVQFIGGEPTQHPALIELMEFARQLGMEVEVFSNLVAINQATWNAFQRLGVNLATSWYTDDVVQHHAITHGGPSDYQTTLGNIQQALKLEIPLRVGMIEVIVDQRIKEGRRQLIELGVRPEMIGIDTMRPVGRGQRDVASANGGQSTDSLCGNCTSGVLAITENGVVQPCVLATGFPTGNILTQGGIAEVLDARPYQVVSERLTAAFAARWGKSEHRDHRACSPQGGGVCGPSACRPGLGVSAPVNRESAG